MNTPLTFEELPLRQRKAARVRYTLIQGVMSRTSERRFADILVSELCDDAGITQPTFFSYFPTKDFLLVHIILLWGLEAEWHARRAERRRGALGTIESVFAFFAAKASESPRLCGELLALQGTREGPPRFPEIPTADRKLWHPDLEGIDDIEPVGILGILRPRIRRAIENGELPRASDPEVVLTTLGSVFFGVILLTRWEDPSAIAGRFREQLRIAWKGLGARRRVAIE